MRIYRISERVKRILQRQSAAMTLRFNAFFTTQFRNIGYISHYILAINQLNAQNLVL